MEELPGLYFMRARYYSAEAAVFLSTDPVKKIGPGWKPEAYNYVVGNPLTQIDPNGLAPVYYDEETRKVIEPAMDEILSTPEGRKLVVELGFKDVRFQVVPGFNVSWNLPSSGSPVGLIWIDPASLPNVYTTAGIKAATVTEAVAHELGHVAHLYGDSGPGRMLNVQTSEAPITRRLYGWDRTKYESAPSAPTGTTQTKTGDPLAGGRMSSRQAQTVQAGRYANTANLVQGTVGKLATQAISLAAPFIGGFAADAFGRILPKSTPPVLKEAAKLLVAKAVTSVVQASAPYLGAAVGAVAGVAVAAVASTAKAVVAVVVAIFGMPKPLIFLLAFICVAALFEYWRYRRRRRLPDSAVT